MVGVHFRSDEGSLVNEGDRRSAELWLAIMLMTFPGMSTALSCYGTDIRGLNAIHITLDNIH